MAAYVYEAVLDYRSTDNLLQEIRALVQELRQCRPELAGCILADLDLARNSSLVNVTLYFRK